jgi:hypothetical protein
MVAARLSLIGFLAFAGFCCAQTSSTPMSQNETGIEGVITISPTHGGPVRIGEQSSKPLANTTFVVANDKAAVAEFTTDDHGNFKAPVAPGHYKVLRKGYHGKIGRYGPFDVDVTAGRMTKVEWRCDSGMR